MERMTAMTAPAGGRRQRDAAIVADRARGMRPALIAQRNGVTERTVRRVLAAWRESRPILGRVDPVAEIAATLAAYEQAAEDLAALAEDASQDAVKLGAIVRRVELVEHRLSLMRAVGLVPQRVGEWLAGPAMTDLLHDFVALIERHGIDRAIVEEFVELRDRVHRERRELNAAA